MLLAQIVGATLLVGLISLTGVVLLVRRNDLHKMTIFLISLASGSLLGGAFSHLIPESLDMKGKAALPLIGGGVFLFFVLEKFLIWRHCHTHQEHEHFNRATAARMVILGDAFHNVLDGAIIATSFSVGVPVGISTTVAILLHEIPQELGDFAILLHGGFAVKRALLLNAASALFAVFGAIGTYFFLDFAPTANSYLLPITAGGFLYVALADLIPQLHEKNTLRQSLIQILLVATGFLSISILGHHH